MDSATRVAEELSLPARHVAAVMALLEDGNTVPFIARYRKEATGALDEVQIRAIKTRREYWAEFAQRQAAILKLIDEQGKLTDELRKRIVDCVSKSELEDLYAPYKRKRRTRAAIARERGLEPLAQRIIDQRKNGIPTKDARAYVAPDKGIADADAALAGARDIVAEIISDDARVRSIIRKRFVTTGEIVSRKKSSKVTAPSKFEQYYEFSELAKTIPSHRFLAIARGEAEGALRVKICVDDECATREIQALYKPSSTSGYADQLRDAIADSYKRLVAPSAETELRNELKQRSDETAIEVFGANLRNLLLAAPLGGQCVLGVDPGLRTGCKCVVVDDTGAYQDHTTLFLTRSDQERERARTQLLALIDKFAPQAIAIGNGTGGREAEAFVRSLLRERTGDKPTVISVSESGASIYSASDIAREEFPDLDLTIRGAISIARRLQDPLAELVKLDPKSIGVGQYQHDVNQPLLRKSLSDVVESCVNHVGVELNTASASLLSYVAGIGPKLAKSMVGHRNKTGRFPTRRSVLKVPGLGPKAFEQAAGFLRIRDGKEPLDASAVHPESYKLVHKIATDLQTNVTELIGDTATIDSINVGQYTTNSVGDHTLRDILLELKKPGRDPRDQFDAPQFRDDVHDITDLTPGMALEGVVTNVAAFGAFVDIGVHQDGLVHISQLADRFVKDPNRVVKVGDKLKVRVLDVDVARKRISLTAKKAHEKPRQEPTPRSSKNKPASPRSESQPRQFSNSPFAKLNKK